MTKRSATASRILEASRKLFNAKGYTATSVTEIAASLGMSQGNLTYHFPTKQALAMAVEDDLLLTMQRRRANLVPGTLAEDYLEQVLFGLEVTWRFRFVMRDHRHYAGGPIGHRPDSQLKADLGDLTTLLKRAKDEGLFVEPEIDLDSLARSLWIVSRYWIDYLAEVEALEQPSWEDQERGVRQHLAILLPRLRASARREFEEALERRQRTTMADLVS
jgi:AcrR family transcriptional regulator